MEANAKDMSILEIYDTDTLQDRDIEAPLPPLDTHQGEAPSVDTPPSETSICRGNTQQNNLAIDDDFLGKVVRQGRRRTSSTSSVTSSASTGAASMNNIFDNTPLEALLASLRKIINSTTGPSSKQRPRLTVGLMEAGKAIINQMGKKSNLLCHTSHDRA
ncbi:hypothetical protein AVEN_65406-1 [Araneus ventricosus]|uniref:Uncharacterized protein n=1 Tax=Araneus ventricosus TaxID=182803 RepID=A0A4Y2RRN1_ARAVE|nr:hypothetical protein AVEN_65406-1 [Araneus ventricosus]